MVTEVEMTVWIRLV